MQLMAAREFRCSMALHNVKPRTLDTGARGTFQQRLYRRWA